MDEAEISKKCIFRVCALHFHQILRAMFYFESVPFWLKSIWTQILLCSFWSQNKLQKFLPQKASVWVSLFVLDFLTLKIWWKRTSFFIDSLLWYVKGDLYQDHDAEAAFVNFCIL